MQNDDHQCSQTEIVFRRRALQTNSGIYARRNGPSILPILSSVELRSRYVAHIEWLGSEVLWSAADARRIGALAAEIARFGRGRMPEAAEACAWHVARLRELVAQYEALRRLETDRRLPEPWSVVPVRQPAPSRRKAGQASTR